MPDYEIANNDLAEVTMWATYQSSIIMNTWHFNAQYPGGGTVADGPAEMTNLLETFYDNVVAPIAGVKWTDWTVQNFNFDYLSGQIIDPQRYYYQIRNIDITGDVAADGCPSNAGCTISWQSNKVGRGRTGSKHFTGMANTEIAAGSFQPAFLADVAETAQKSAADIDGIDPGLLWKCTLWSQAHPSERNRIVSQYANPDVRIMRRRTLHVGI